MKRASTTCAAFATATMLITGPGAFAAQEPMPREMPEAQEPARTQAVTGELLEIDPDTMTLTIRSADETELSFAYTPATVVVGSQEGIAGLATNEGVLVTVYFDEEGGTRTATRIDVDERR